MKILIVGANGLLGNALSAACAAAGIPAVRASHRMPADVILDLSQPLDDPLRRLPRGITHAVVCSAISNIDRCFEFPAETAFFNVRQTTALFAGLAGAGILPVFCSSDLVFRGDRGAYAETDACVPGTRYGQQKRAAECALEDAGGDHLIVRFSKLYSVDAADTSPIRQTITALRQGLPVNAALDGVICPTNAADAAAGVTRLIAAGARGTFHIAPPAGGWYTRHSLAMALAARLGREDLVRSCMLADLPVKDPRPPNNSLRSEKLAALLGWRPRILTADLDAIFRV